MPDMASRVCVAPRRVCRAAMRGALSALILLAAPTAAWADERPPEERLAGELLQGIPAGTSIAVRPFRLLKDSARLPDDLGRRMYNSLVTALVARAHDTGVNMLTRRLGDIYDIRLDHHSKTDLDTLLRNARADVEILCPVTAGPEHRTVRLSCQATKVGSGEDSGDLVSAVEADLRLEWSDMLDFALNQVADEIVAGGPPDWELGGVRFVERSGCQSELGDFAGPRLREQVRGLLKKRADARVIVVTGDGSAAAEPEAVSVYAVHGTLRRYDDDRLIALEVSLIDPRDGGGRSLVDVVRDVAAGPLPPEFSRHRCAEHAAEGQARVSERLHEASARRAALNLARARVVAQALGLAAPDVARVTSEEEAVAVLASLLRSGLTVEERSDYRSAGSAADRIEVRLRAQVVPVGSIAAPAVRASLDRAVYRARTDPIRIEITSDEPTHLGVFAWGADDLVVRLYPRTGASLAVDAGDTLSLPRPEDGHLLTEPLPGNDQDHEALIVVALREQADFAALAPALTDLTAGETQPPDGQRFIAALAELDAPRMAVVMLPYRVLR